MSKLVFIFNCANCGKEYQILETQVNINKNRYRKNCSKKCSHSRKLSDITKNKISEKLKSKVIKITKKCPTCENVFVIKRKKQIFCSKKCSVINRNKNGLASKAGLKSASILIRRSKNEIEFGNKCKQFFSNIDYNTNIFNGWDADIILHDIKIAILWNGIWHYKKIKKEHSVKQVQNRDNIKINEIIKYGYTPYIIKDMGKYSIQKIEQEWQIFLKWLKENNLVN